MLNILPVKPIPEVSSLTEINIRFGLLSLEAKDNHLNEGNIYEFLRLFMVAIFVCRNRVVSRTVDEFYMIFDTMIFHAGEASLDFDEPFRNKLFDLAQLYFKICNTHHVDDREIIKHAEEVNNLLGLADKPIYPGYEPATVR